MARGIEGNEMSSAKSAKPSRPMASQASQAGQKTQKTLLGFFQKKPATRVEEETSAQLTPAPSSDAGDLSSPVKSHASTAKHSSNGALPSPPTSAVVADRSAREVTSNGVMSSPSRKAKKAVNYAESDDDEEDEDVFKPLSGNRRPSKRRKVVSDDDEDDEYGMDAAELDQRASDDDMDDFVVADDSADDAAKPKKRKRPAKPSSRVPSSPPPPPSLAKIPTEDMEIPTESTTQKWKFDPDNPASTEARPPASRPAQSAATSLKKKKAHATPPEKRYTWLATIQDADRHAPDHPDYDPRTLYVPPNAWNNFSPFEKQYWEIKQNFWDTIVFFKKGKFYELYEKDAVIGHQLFDLKLTDRVNMSMVGVPEASLDHWAVQFVAKGYKIARVDQMESALGKEMRERDDDKPKGKPVKADKIIRRELASVLTSGTLVDTGMLQGDMSTYCVAIKQGEKDDKPCFGIAFVDTATAQFHLTSLVDDADMTKFETFVAQIRPGELLLEKGALSSRASRILKNNTSPTTLWNWLKPTKEFWPAEVTSRDIDASGYFVKREDASDAWPKALRAAEDSELVMSSFGALTQYLRVLKIDRDLISLGNINWYDPIRRGSTLILDGQSLINLEIFANSFDGGPDGTLFSMLNRCVTPFGKRMLRRWVCHPLADARAINARLDAVEALMADKTTTSRFTESLTKMPDLERLISRVHAKRCRAQDFVKVLDGFEQIEYTISLLQEHGKGEGVISDLISSTPDLKSKLDGWKDAFDRKVAKDDGLLVPKRGVEDDFDEVSDQIDDCEAALDEVLQKARKDLGSSRIEFRDNGKEIYQIEVPAVIKKIPSNWDQMSATAKVKRYYFPELRKLVRNLQEARETHASIQKQVAGRFCARFDEDYTEWLSAVRIVAQLDCLISLARASASMGTPSCRPDLVNDDSDDSRAVVDFRDLRHPTMLTAVSDFIPNDVVLGGAAPRLNLLTGANAAGKSTVLRMTCVAVILAQLGAYVPASSATLTPRDRIMSRLGANDNILQQQSTFFVELAETKKMLTEASPRSLVILDELGRGTSSVDGLAVADAALHHVAGHVGCVGFFATHYHSLAAEYAAHPEVAVKRMAIAVDDAARRVTFLYRLEDGVAEGSFGMHCANMCGIPAAVVARAEEAAGRFEWSRRVEDAFVKQGKERLGLGWCSDVAWALRAADPDRTRDGAEDEGEMNLLALDVLRRAIETM